MRIHSAMILALCVVAAPSVAATLRVPKDHPTIQAAVNAAVDGDTVVVSRGTYAEAVVIDSKQDFTLRGSGRPTIDGQNTVVPLTVQNSGRVTITGFTVERSVGVGIMLDFTSDSVVSGCRVRDSAGDGIRDLGSLRARIERNGVERAGGDCIELFTNAGRVLRNRLENCVEDGVEVNGGSAHEVVGNRIRGPAMDGVRLETELTTAAANRISGVSGAGIRIVRGPNLVERNRIQDPAGHGIVVDTGALGNAVVANRVTAAGAHGVLVVNGSHANQLQSNRVAGAALDGFHLEGAANVLVGNRGSGSGGVDYFEGGPNLLQRNRFGTVAP